MNDKIPVGTVQAGDMYQLITVDNEVVFESKSAFEVMRKRRELVYDNETHRNMCVDEYPEEHRIRMEQQFGAGIAGIVLNSR